MDRPLLWADQKEVADAARKTTPNEWLETRRLYLETYSTPAGQETLVRWLYQSNFFRRNFTGNSVGTVLESQRYVIIHLLEFIPELIGKVFYEYCQQADKDQVREMMLRLDEERLLNG